MTQGKPRQKYLKKNLIFLCYYHCRLLITKTQPEEVTLDLANGTWSFQIEGREEQFEIGGIYRYDQCNWGPIAVYDQSNFAHIKSLIRAVQALLEDPTLEECRL